MAREKPAKAKIKRRSAGLVITPPAPRPVEADHPARLLFREAIEYAKAVAESEREENKPVAKAKPSESQLQARTESKTAGEVIPRTAEPLQIFKELKEAPTPQWEAQTPVAALRRDHIDAFEEHFGQWKQFLSEGEICVLQALFNMTHAIGKDHCLTSMPKVATAAGISERQTYNVVKELEKHGFIERPETFNTPTKKGTIFRLYLTRLTSPSTADRLYHFGD